MNKENKARKSAFDVVMSLIMTAVCVVVAVFIILNLTGNDETGLAIQQETAGQDSVNVSVETVTAQDFATYTRLFGDIVTDTDPVDLYSDVSGRVTSVLVSRGDTVNSGDIVAYVDQSRPGYNYQESAVRSTVSGEVLSLDAAAGDTVTSSTVLMSIRTDDDLKIRTTVPERYISALRLGDTSTFTVTAYSGMKFNASLTYIAPVVDTTTRTVEVELDIEDGQDLLLEGMFATVSLETMRQEDVFTVPSSAILTDNQGDYVLIVEDGVSAKAYVTRGTDDGERTVITSGLEAGDQVITSGSTTAGVTVSVVGED